MYPLITPPTPTNEDTKNKKSGGEKNGESERGRGSTHGSTPLVLESRFGDKPVKFQVACPQNGTAVLKGLHVRANKSLITSQLTTPTHRTPNETNKSHLLLNLLLWRLLLRRRELALRLGRLVGEDEGGKGVGG